MDKSKAIDTPMATSCNLDNDKGGKPVDESKYRGMIGYVLYLTPSCPNIMFFVCPCTHFLASLKESLLSTIKHI